MMVPPAPESLPSIFTSAPAALTIVAPPGNSYPEKIVTNIPYAYWRLNETADPASNYAIALDYAGGFNGVYGSAALNGFNGITGPRPSDRGTRQRAYFADEKRIGGAGVDRAGGDLALRRQCALRGVRH